MDDGGGRHTQENVVDAALHGNSESHSDTHRNSLEDPSGQIGFETPEVGALRSSHQSKDTAVVADRSSLFGRFSGRRRSYYDFGEQPEARIVAGVSVGPRAGDCEQLSENGSVCETASTVGKLAGDACGDKQCTQFGQGASSHISHVVFRNVDRGNSTGTDSVYDIKKGTSEIGTCVCAEQIKARLHGQLQREGDEIVVSSATNELATWEELVSVERVPTPAEVFDLCTSTRTFVANGLVVHNCDLEFYKKKPDIKRTERYLFLARMSRIKGPHIAVDLARKLRFGLDLVGDDRITGEPELAQRMQMMAQHNIKYHGGVSREKAVEFFSGAKALIHSAKDFREPFGLAPIEAQSCGVPVLAFDNGAMRETIVHGKTGFVCKTIEEMEELIKTDAVKSIKAKDCVENAQRFSVKRMVDRYEELCKEALECPW
jgi:glycosyltransferase involved in cell wall biosynthesis